MQNAFIPFLVCAVITAVPLPDALITPDCETVATESSELDQVIFSVFFAGESVTLGVALFPYASVTSVMLSVIESASMRLPSFSEELNLVSTVLKLRAAAFATLSAISPSEKRLRVSDAESVCAESLLNSLSVVQRVPGYISFPFSALTNILMFLPPRISFASAVFS